MTDPQRIRSRITHLESEGGSREADIEYGILLDLCTCYDDDGKPTSRSLIYMDLHGAEASKLPHFTTNAQDALDSLPEPCGWNFKRRVGGCYFELFVGRDEEEGPNGVGQASTEAATLCLARLNMELEGG